MAEDGRGAGAGAAKGGGAEDAGARGGIGGGGSTFRELSDPLGDEIAALVAHRDAADYRLLVLLNIYDSERLWKDFRSCAHWLSYRTGMTMGPARERVRVARRLAELPLIAAELAKGRVSYSKVRAVTRVATPENEERFVEFMKGSTASQVERLVRSWRGLDLAAEETAWGETRMRSLRSVTLRQKAGGMWELRGQLTPEDAAVETARRRDAAAREAAAEAGERARAEAEAAAAEAGEEAPAWEPRPLRLAPTRGQLRHDALADWVRGAAGAKVELLVHAVAGNADTVATRDGAHLPAETSRRLACDAGRRRVDRGGDGSVLDVGRRTRAVGVRLRRALEVRDGGCRFPGCDARSGLHAHHAVHWADGGPTSLDNLVLLCHFHHRLVHEGRWSVAMGPGGRATFRDPGGAELPPVPPPRPDVEAPWTQGAGLEDWHRQKGVNPWTMRTNWSGDRMDLDWALLALWGNQPNGKEPEPEPDPGGAQTR